jgi:hypothetical protein
MIGWLSLARPCLGALENIRWHLSTSMPTMEIMPILRREGQRHKGSYCGREPKRRLFGIFKASVQRRVGCEIASQLPTSYHCVE